jgi:hypothetical protein
LRGRYDNIKEGIAGTSLRDPCGNHRPVEIVVVGVGRFDVHISENGIPQPCLDTFYAIAIIDVTDDSIVGA